MYVFTCLQALGSNGQLVILSYFGYKHEIVILVQLEALQWWLKHDIWEMVIIYTCCKPQIKQELKEKTSRTAPLPRVETATFPLYTCSLYIRNRSKPRKKLLTGKWRILATLYWLVIEKLDNACVFVHNRVPTSCISHCLNRQKKKKKIYESLISLSRLIQALCTKSVPPLKLNGYKRPRLLCLNH